MTPTESRLLQGIRDALNPLRDSNRPDADRRIASSIDLAIDELLLRHDTPFLDKQIADGEQLQWQAVTLGAPAPSRAEDIPILERLFQSLSSQASFLVQREREEPEAAALLEKLVDWENRVHERRANFGRNAAKEPEKSGPIATPETLEAYFRKNQPGWKNLRITNLQTLAGGFSKVTLMFDISDDENGPRSLVLRAEQPLNLVFLEGARLSNEFQVLNLAWSAGLPVAEPLWFEKNHSIIGMPFIVSRRALGRNFGSRIDVQDAVSHELVRDMVSKLVQIHSVPIDQENVCVAKSHLSRWAAFKTLSECLDAQVEYWRDGAASFDLKPAPILTRALGWLKSNVPTNDAPPVLLHGDFGLHNLLIGEDNRVSCILDWEAVTLGDPIDDLTWLSDGLSGVVDRETIIELYTELGGRPVKKSDLPFFDVFSAVRFGVTCPRALDLFQTNANMPLEALRLGLVYMHHGTRSLNRHIALYNQGLRQE